MGRLRHILGRLLLVPLLLGALPGNAQEEKLNRAQQMLRQKNYEAAKNAIDSAVLHPQTTKDFITWTTRAYAYYGLYSRSDKQKLNSALRDSAISSIKKSYTLQPDSDYINENRKLITVLASHYYNIAVHYLQDSLNADKSQLAYAKYKELSTIANKSFDGAAKDIEFNLSMGSTFASAYQKDYNNTQAHELARVAYLKVLEVQPENPNALMNMGLMYYNQAVNLSKKLDYGADLSEIDIVQDNMVKLARQSEQLIVKVYNNDKKNAKACEALRYIYRMLSDIPKSDDFKRKAEELGVKFVDENTSQANDQK